MIQYIFPVTLIVLQVAAAVAYGITGDKWIAAYWVFAAALNITVTFKP